jgi:hypothetical protein
MRATRRGDAMRILQARLGKTWKWMVAFPIFALVGIFSPAMAAEWWHVRHPNVIACEGFTVQIPLFWSGDNVEAPTICERGFALTKFGATLFGSADNGSSVSLITKVHTGGNRKVTDLEGVFRSTHPNDAPVPYKLDGSFDDCLSVEDQSKKMWPIDVVCTDETRGLILLASGSPNALSQVSTMIH